MSNLPWFRLYHRVIDDEKIRLLAFEDRWHFIAVCCIKADGLLDDPESDLKWRKVAVKLGVQLRELDEIKRRLFEVGLVNKDMQPSAWDELQYRSDNSTDRVRRYREKLKKNNDETQRNVSVTAQDTDTDTDTDNTSSLRSDDRRTPRQELETVLDSEHARDVIEHRQRLRKPLTAKAAKLLARQLAQCPDPNAAADLMIERGWLAIKPDWVHNAQQPRGSPGRAQRIDHFKEFAERISGQTGNGTGERGDWVDAESVPVLTIEHQR